MTTGKPSSTALLIVRTLLLLAHEPLLSAWISPSMRDWCRAFLAEGGGATASARSSRARRWEALCKRPAFRAFCYAVERQTAPGIIVHYTLRKLFLEETARRFLAETSGRNAKAQIVVLGGGFDTLALRLSAEYPDARFVELDHPATQQVKRDALARRDFRQPNFEMIACDLSEEPSNTTIREIAARGDYRTLFIAEGLLMYLTEARVEALFTAACALPHSRIAFTFLEVGEKGSADFEEPHYLIDQWLRLRGEPFRWGIPREKLATWLTPLGWRLANTPLTADDLRRRYLTAEENTYSLPPRYRPARGDLIGIADSTI